MWEPSPTGWKPTLVLLRINRAATFVRWSPSERKFAVGSGARVVAICYFEEENDWWVSKHLKKPIRSTITTVAWHPNSVLLAAGSTDAHARVFSSFIKGVDEKPESSVWGERLPFNTVCGEYLNNSAGWVHGTAFSPSGDALAFTAHDSSITVVYPNGPDQPPKSIVSVTTQLLPFMSLIWNGEGEIIAAGYVRLHSCSLPATFPSHRMSCHTRPTLTRRSGLRSLPTAGERARVGDRGLPRRHDGRAAAPGPAGKWRARGIRAEHVPADGSQGPARGQGRHAAQHRPSEHHLHP